MEPDLDTLQADDQELEDRSAFDRFADAFTSPSEAADGLQLSHRRGSIITFAFVIALVISAFSGVMLVSNPAVMDSIRQEQTKQLDKLRESGKLPESSYDTQLERLDMAPATFVATTALSSAIWLILEMLVIGLIALILMKVLQRDSAEVAIGYGTALALAGVMEMIRFTSHIVQALGIFFTNDIRFDPSLAWFVKSENALVQFATGLVNPFMWWWLIAIGTGTAVIARGDRTKSITYWSAIWIVLGFLMALVGMFFKNAFGVG